MCSARLVNVRNAVLTLSGPHVVRPSAGTGAPVASPGQAPVVVEEIVPQIAAPAVVEGPSPAVEPEPGMEQFRVSAASVDGEDPAGRFSNVVRRAAPIFKHRVTLIRDLPPVVLPNGRGTDQKPAAPPLDGPRTIVLRDYAPPVAAEMDVADGRPSPRMRRKLLGIFAGLAFLASGAAVVLAFGVVPALVGAVGGVAGLVIGWRTRRIRGHGPLDFLSAVFRAMVGGVLGVIVGVLIGSIL